MLQLMKAIEDINKIMKEHGFQTNLEYGNDNFSVSEKEVIIKVPYELKFTIPRSSFEGSDIDVSRVVSQAISQALSPTKGR